MATLMVGGPADGETYTVPEHVRLLTDPGHWGGVYLQRRLSNQIDALVFVPAGEVRDVPVAPQGGHSWVKTKRTVDWG